MDYFLLPFRALVEGDRIANRLYVSAMAKFLTLVVSYLIFLWAGAVYDVQWLTIGAMWVYTAIVFVTYLQPNVAGVLSIVEWLRKSDDPKKSGVVRGGLIIIISVITLGGEALIFGFFGLGAQFPLGVLITLLAVAGALATGASKLEIWLPRITKVGVAILVVATVAGFVRDNPEVLARVGIDAGALKVRPSETKRVENAERDHVIADKREEAKAKSVAMLQECRVPQPAVAQFTKEQSVIYIEACNGAFGTPGMRLAEVYRGWPTLKPGPTSPHGEEGKGARGSNQGKAPEWVPMWARDWGPVQWMTGSAIGLILMHVILWSPFLALLAWLGFKVGKKEDDKKVTAKATATESGVRLGTILLLGLAIAGGYLAYQHWNDPSKIVAPTPLLPSITPLTSENFVAQYTTKNAHRLMPQHHWHGKPVTLAEGSSVAEKIDATLVFDQDATWNLGLSGNCVNTGNARVPRTCAGQYNAGQGYVGAFRCEWGEGGKHFSCKLYAEDRIYEAKHPIAEVLIYRK